MIERTKNLIDSECDHLEARQADLLKFILRACELLEGHNGGSYDRILTVGRSNIVGTADLSTIRAAKEDLHYNLDLALENYRPQIAASHRMLRYLLGEPHERIDDWFHFLWMFVDVAEQAGLSDTELEPLLKDALFAH